MEHPPQPHPFDRNGLARLSDFGAPEWHEAFQSMATMQQRFLEQESQFRSLEYRRKWPCDALRNWSRAWEYPYTYHHLQRQRTDSLNDLVAADLGSGVTFMPFAVAALGYDVRCLDIDPVVGRDLSRAARLLRPEGRRVSFHQMDGEAIPLEDASVDAVYCISVLEHLSQPQHLLREVSRVLVPGGLFILTMDLAAKGTRLEIGAHDHARILEALYDSFEDAAPFRSVHPADVLTSRSGPFARRRPAWRRALRNTLLGVSRFCGRDREAYWACEGLALRRAA